MPITRTINYTQNVPITLGFGAAYLNPSPSRTVRVLFSFNNTLSDSKMGKVTFPVVAGVKQFYGQTSPDDNIVGNIYIEGEVSAVNTALDGAMFVNHYYEAENLAQDFLSQDRALPTDYRGEMQIQINKDVVHGLSVGSFCRISTVSANPNLSGQFLVTAIDATNSGTRLWLSFRGGWNTDEIYFGGSYKNVGVTKDNAGNAAQTGSVTKAYTPYYLQTTSSVNIAPINDVSFINPHGTFDSLVSVIEGTTTVESGTITYVGDFFIAEPSFVTPPAASISYAAQTWTNSLGMGVIEQADDNYQSVQLLIKALENDPNYLNISSYTLLAGYPSGGTLDEQLAFIGAAIEAKASKDIPRYIIDHTYGLFGTVQVGERISAVYSTGPVRWSFYGTPDDCNEALLRTTYYGYSATKDFNVETRIVNGRTRIYSQRGK